MTHDIDAAGARTRIASHVRRTPVITLAAGELGVTGPTLLKLELMQHSGSFKARGAFNAILAARERADLPGAGVIAASGGNHGLALAHAARQLGIHAEVFVPELAGAVKLDRIRALGAEVSVVGAQYADAYAACRTRSEVTGALFVHAYDHPDVVAGQGTLALELLDQVPGLDTIIVAVGGGGLSAGIVAALAGRAKVVAVEPENIPTLHAALAAGQPVDVDVSGVAADSLGARRIGDIAYDVLSVSPGERVSSVLVSDAAIVAARQLLWDELRLAAEFGGAAALAALTTGAYVPADGERVVVVVCGGNTDPCDLAQGSTPWRSGHPRGPKTTSVPGAAPTR